MSTNEFLLRNITTDDFIFGNVPQAQRFWLIAYDAFQNITSDWNRNALTERALSKKYPRHGSAGHFGFAVTNPTVTDAIKQFLPLEYKDASHTWICGQFQTSIARDFLERLSEVAREEFCNAIPLNKPVVAVGNTFFVSACFLILVACSTVILLYLTHAATNGPRRTLPEIVKDEKDEKRKKLGTLLTSQAISTPPLRYPPAFSSLLYPWMTTVALLSPCTFLWALYGNPNSRYGYNEALTFLTLRVSTSITSCLLPLPCKFLELPSLTNSNACAFYILLPSMMIFLTDITTLGLPQDFDHPNLFFRDELCSEQFFLNSLTWLRLLVVLKYVVLVGMSVLYAIVCYALSLLFKFRNSKDHQRPWQSELERWWSLVHQLKIWVVIELVSLAQASCSIWWIRRKVIEEGLYADFRSSVFDGSSFLACLLYLLVGGFVAVITMDMKARWSRMALWSKLDETVDGSDDPPETELEILAAKKHSNWMDTFATR